MPPSPSTYYLFNRFYLKNGNQLERIREFCKNTFLPALERHCTGPKIFLQATVAEHMPQVAMFCGLESFQEYGALREQLGGDREFGQGFFRWEDYHHAPVEHYSTSLLRATAYSPTPQPADPQPESPRLFELRTYHSPSHKQLYFLHQRFAGPETGIFGRLGIRPLFYTDTEFGPRKPCLVYLTPFANLAEREEKWAAFSADPEWKQVKEESIKEGGQISSTMHVTLFTAAAYSPIR
jgi:hypothetical protein